MIVLTARTQAFQLFFMATEVTEFAGNVKSATTTNTRVITACLATKAVNRASDHHSRTALPAPLLTSSQIRTVNAFSSAKKK